MYFGVVISVYGLTLWLPQIIKAVGGLTNVEVGFMTAVSYALAAVAMYKLGRALRRHRRAHMACGRAGVNGGCRPGVQRLLG